MNPYKTRYKTRDSERRTWSLERVLGWVQRMASVCQSISKSNSTPSARASGKRGILEELRQAVPKYEGAKDEIAKILPGIEGAMSTIDPISKAFKTQSTVKV